MEQWAANGVAATSPRPALHSRTVAESADKKRKIERAFARSIASAAHEVANQSLLTSINKTTFLSFGSTIAISASLSSRTT